MKVVSAHDQPTRSRRYALLLAVRDSEYVLKAYDGYFTKALLLAVRDSEYVLKAYDGYFNVFVSAFGCGGDGDASEEAWGMFRAVDGELPAMEDLDGYEGFVISGSPYDAYAEELWILRLCLLIQDLVAAPKRVICRALGGRVGKARVGGWDIGIREVTMAATLPPCRFLDLLPALPPYAKITECHQDEVVVLPLGPVNVWTGPVVWEPPMGAEVLASLDKTGVEIFWVGDNVLGIQGHPEYTAEILLSLVDRLSSSQSITVSIAEGVKRQLEAIGPDREF
ncbi:unnamed protein product [Alopecurus aequalis]